MDRAIIVTGACFGFTGYLESIKSVFGDKTIGRPNEIIFKINVTPLFV